MAAGQGPNVRRRRLGAVLRRLREAAGMTLVQAAEQLDSSDSTLSRLENGRGRIRRTDVKAMLELYGVEDEQLREWLLKLTRDVRRKGWWQDYRDVVSDPYADYISLEADAATIRAHTIQFVHGLLQTEDYAREVVEAGRVWERPEEIDKVVAVRMARQQVLTREDPLELWAVMSELVLRQPVGGPEVMRAQLERLLEVGRWPNVTVQVLPFSAGAHAGMDEPFAILGFPALTEPDVVFLDHITSALYLEHEEEIRRYTLVFDHLRSAALAPRASASLIAKTIKEL